MIFNEQKKIIFSFLLVKNIKTQTTAQLHTGSLQGMPIKFTTSAYAQWAGRPTAWCLISSGWVPRAVWLQDFTYMQHVTKGGFLSVKRRQLSTFFPSCSLSKKKFLTCWARSKKLWSEWKSTFFFFCYPFKENLNWFQSSFKQGNWCLKVGFNNWWKTVTVCFYVRPENSNAHLNSTQQESILSQIMQL